MVVREDLIRVMVGKVPAKVVDIEVSAGLNIEQVMRIGAEKCGFSFTTKVYTVNGKEMLDVPFLGGKEMCRRENQRGASVIVEVFWNHPVNDGDIILIIPKIKGN